MVIRPDCLTLEINGTQALETLLASSDGSVSFCVQNRLRAKSGHGKRLIDEIDLLTKEQSHDHPNQA